MPGEVFGEAEVILRGRLDLLQQDMDKAEMLVVQQQQRLRIAQDETAGSARRASVEGEKAGGALGAVAKAYGAWKLLRKGINAAITAVTLAPAAASAAGAAMAAAAVAGAVAVVGVLGLIADSASKAGDKVNEVIDSFRGLDGSTQSARQLAEALRELPLVGRAASFSFRAFGKDTQLADEAWMGLVADIEDGEVKVGLAGRAVSGVVYALSLGFVDLAGDIRRVNEEMAKMNAQNAVRAGYNAFGDQQQATSDGIEGNASRANELQGLEGADRIRAENRITHDQAMSQFDAQRDELNATHSQIMANIRLRQAEGEINAKQARAQAAAANLNKSQGVARIEAARARTAADLTDLAAKRVAAAKQEAEQARKLEESETNRLRVMAKTASMRAAGDDLGADLVSLEHLRQLAITRAIEEGQQNNLAFINQYYNAREAMARDSHDRSIDAERDAQRRKLKTIEDAAERERQIEERRENRRNDVEDQIFVESLRANGEDDFADEQEERNRANQEIRDAIESGDTELAELLTQLRDIRLRRLEQQQKEQAMADAERANADRLRDAERFGQAQAKQVDSALDLIGFGGPNEELREAKKQTKELSKIAGNTKDNVARAT